MSVTGAVSDGNGSHGLSASFAQNVTVTGGSFSISGYYGIDILAAGAITLDGVTADGNSWDGAYLTRYDDGIPTTVSVTGSSFVGNASEGVRVGGYILGNGVDPAVVIEGNEIRDNATGVLISEYSTNQVRFNNITGNTTGLSIGTAFPLQTPDLSENWWGSYAGPGATDQGGRTGDTVVGPAVGSWSYGEFGANFDGDAWDDGHATSADPDDDNDGQLDVDEVAAGTDPLNDDITPPTVSIEDIGVQMAAVNEIEITFSEVVTGFDLADLTLTLDGTPVSLTGTATLTPGAPGVYTLGNLSSLTGSNGDYELTLTAPGGIKDIAGNPLAVGASDSWEKYDVVINGTGGADTFVVTTDGTFHYVQINSDPATSYDATYEIYISVTGGDDILRVYDSTGDDTLTADPSRATMDWETGGMATSDGFRTVYAYASVGGTDTAILDDSAGLDRFYGYATYGLMTDSSFFNYAFSFETITANASGGSDTAYLFGSGGDDAFVADPNAASMTRSGASTSEANGFAKAYGYAAAGGTDTAAMSGSANADRFYGLDTYAFMTDATMSYYNYASGFSLASGSASGAGDIAYFYGSNGDDSFTADSSVASMTRIGAATSEASGFEKVYGYAVAGGTDTATLNGSGGADKFYGYATSGLMTGTSSANYAFDFGVITANASGADDFAYLYGSGGDDNLTAGASAVSMTRSTASTSNANGFERVYGYAGAGGTDTATLNGSGGADKFHGYATYGMMTDTSFMNYAFDFGVITANASGVGDFAYLYGSGGDDSFTADASAASMTRSTASTSEAIGFEKVFGYAAAGGTDTATLNGSGGADKFYGYATSGLMTSTSSANYAFDFGVITANASGAGDFAYLYGSGGDDSFTADASAASMTRSTASTSNANGFERVYGYAAAGGADTATLNGSGGADKFYGYATSGLMTGTSFMNYAFDFGTITGNASGAGDFAYLYGSGGDDSFTADASAASMTRSTASTSEANGFERVYGYAAAGGTDTATLNGSTGADNFYGYATYGMMTGTSFMNYAFDFGVITANASGAGDFAYLYGSGGDDSFTADASVASMTRSTASTSVANGFERVYGYAAAGGTDTATLNGSTGADNFYGYASYGMMTGTSFMNYAFDFGVITANASGAGDFAYLYGSGGDDSFTADASAASMTRSTASTSEAIGFERVFGYAAAGGTDTATLNGSGGADKFYGYASYGMMTGNLVHELRLRFRSDHGQCLGGRRLRLSVRQRRRRQPHSGCQRCLNDPFRCINQQRQRIREGLWLRRSRWYGHRDTQRFGRCR